jgi:hypothetical protein
LLQKLVCLKLLFAALVEEEVLVDLVLLLGTLRQVGEKVLFCG